MIQCPGPRLIKWKIQIGWSYLSILLNQVVKD
uniref:Uncharacterized protein n=1 Tax=Rhizophora mucronata TaxID=61149 RepID=A0A2P2P7Z4_RHIMU